MAWVRIDDHFDEHPKLAAIGPLGWGVWLAGLAYCNRNLTDGFIPRSKARMIASLDSIEDGDGKLWSINRSCGMVGDDIDPQWVIGILVDAGVWDAAPGGYQVHDYNDYQPTKAQIMADREKKQAAGRAGGQASAQARAQAPAQAESKQDASTDSTEAEAESKPKPKPKSTEKSKDFSGAEAPVPITQRKSKPLPESGPAQQIVKAFCDAVGIEKPAAYSKAVGQAQLLADAGVVPDDIAFAVEWCEGQKWLSDGFDLGSILSNAEKWRGAQKRKPARRQADSKGGLVFG